VFLLRETVYRRRHNPHVETNRNDAGVSYREWIGRGYRFVISGLEWYGVCVATIGRFV